MPPLNRIQPYQFYNKGTSAEQIEDRIDNLQKNKIKYTYTLIIKTWTKKDIPSIWQ